MLMAVNGGNVQGCDLRQDQIAHLVTTAQAISDAELSFTFTNYHAIMDYADFFTSLNDLEKVDWSLFFEQPLVGEFSKYWQNRPDPVRHMKRKETRQAEFLVEGQLPLSLIQWVGVRTEKLATQLRTELSDAGWSVPVKAKPDFYY
jgi:hypothetical protein